MRCVLSIGLLLATACAAGTVDGPIDTTRAMEAGDVDAPGGSGDEDPVTQDTDTPSDNDPPPPRCPPVVVPEAIGTTRELTPGTSLASLLAQSAPGDRVRVHAGTYPSESITASFSGDVFIETFPGDVATFAGLTFVASAHLVLRGLSFTDTLDLEGSHHVTLERILIDVGTRDVSALVIDGQQSTGANHDIVVTQSTIHGGARTIFLLGTFAPADTWNHDILVSKCDLACGSHNCFQLSGARDMQIVDNYFHDPLGPAVLTAGATRIEIARNRMLGSPTVDATAIQIATPGEWDPYAGNQYMISSDIVVADNVITGWGGPGISLQAATRIDIVNNTVTTDVGLSTWRRIPHDTAGNVILTGNTDVRLWNNILTTIALDTGDPRPIYETNNLVRSGGGGQALITSDPRFAETDFFSLAADSPAVDAGLATPDTPTVDAFGNGRDGAPDLGANERGGVPPLCP